MRASPVTEQRHADTAVRPPRWPRRVWARLTGTRLDRDLDAGRRVVTGTALAAHAERITSPTERQRLAAGLQVALDRARSGNCVVCPRIRLQCNKILSDEELIGQIVRRLDAAQPVRPRGMARLRLLLSDALGPMYVIGSGSAAAQLRGVIAAL